MLMHMKPNEHVDKIILFIKLYLFFKKITYKLVNAERLPSSDGMAPVNLLKPKALKHNV